MAVGHCPMCDSEIEFDQFNEEVTCSQCGSLLEAIHECCFDWESEEENCYDYLVMRRREK